MAAREQAPPKDGSSIGMRLAGKDRLSPLTKRCKDDVRRRGQYAQAVLQYELRLGRYPGQGTGSKTFVAFSFDSWVLARLYTV